MADARVLVVDDDPEVVRLLEEDLAASGFTVFPAGSGTAALRLLRDTPLDAVVTDLRMPDVDGLEIVRAAAESQPDARVIIVTAFATIASAIDAVEPLIGRIGIRQICRDKVSRYSIRRAAEGIARAYAAVSSRAGAHA